MPSESMTNTVIDLFPKTFIYVSKNKGGIFIIGAAETYNSDRVYLNNKCLWKNKKLTIIDKKNFFGILVSRKEK